jgi:hypothetical protein
MVVASFRVIGVGWTHDDVSATSPAADAPAGAALSSLSDAPFTAQGVDADGWMNREASLVFQLGMSNRTTLSVSGQLPGAPPHGASGLFWSNSRGPGHHVRLAI